MPERRSKRHIEIYEAIKTELPNIQLIEEYNVGSALFIDIYIPAFSIGIEVDGLQHEIQIAYFHKDESEFNAQRMRDSKKHLLAKEQGISLYRVNPTDKRDAKVLVREILRHASSNVGESVCEKCGKSKKLIGGYCIDCIREKRETKDDNKLRRRFNTNKNRTRNYLHN